MDFRFGEAEERFREEVRTFIRETLTPEAIEDNCVGVVRGPHSAEFMHKVAKAGLLGLTWPKEYGGKEMPAIYDYHLNDELAYASAPQIGKGLGIVGRTLMSYGSDFLKQLLLPRIINEDVQFALGYSEPDAGSDLASLRLRAVEDGDDYVLNGQKLFCSTAHCAEWIWLLARTDPDLPKHRGLTVFLVDPSWPGITIRPMQTIGGERTNEVFFDNVRVAKKYLVGKPNHGWKYVMDALAYERQVLFASSVARSNFDRLVEWVKAAERDGKPLAKDPVVRHKIARLAIEVEVCRLNELTVVALGEKGKVGEVEAAMHKLFGSQVEQHIANTAMDIMGPYGLLQKGSKHVQEEGIFETAYRFSLLRTIGGGSSEVEKNIIAKRHLNLPS